MGSANSKRNLSRAVPVGQFEHRDDTVRGGKIPPLVGARLRANFVPRDAREFARNRAPTGVRTNRVEFPAARKSTPIGDRMAKNSRTHGQALVDALRVHGVDTTFCVPGESYLAALDGLYDARDEIRTIICRSFR